VQSRIPAKLLLLLELEGVMKPPEEIDSYEEMEEEVISNLDIDEGELESIMGRVFIESSNPQNIHTDIDGFIDILITHAYREAVERDRKREEHDSEDEIEKLRNKKGGILKNQYSDVDVDKWEAKCESRFCRFNSTQNDTKVDEVICPVCGRELMIEPL